MLLPTLRDPTQDDTWSCLISLPPSWPTAGRCHQHYLPLPFCGKQHTRPRAPDSLCQDLLLVLNFIVYVGSGTAPPAPWHAQLNPAGPWGEEASRASRPPLWFTGLCSSGNRQRGLLGFGSNNLISVFLSLKVFLIEHTALSPLL